MIRANQLVYPKECLTDQTRDDILYDMESITSCEENLKPDLKTTIFRHKRDIKTSHIVSKRSWKKFVDFLQELSKLPYTKNTAPLISPAIYKPGSTRSNDSVIAWAGWSAMDIDNHPFENVEQIRNFIEGKHPNKSYICYSTARSSIEKPKFRFIFPLDEWMTDSIKIRKYWFSLNKEFSEFADKQTKDVSRMYYIPANYSESTYNFFIYKTDGEFFNADSLIKKHRADEFFALSTGASFLDMLPEKMRESVIAHRQTQLKANGKYYSWTSYKDCPFVKKDQVELYRNIVLLNAAGRYLQLYNLMVSIAATAVTMQYPITAGELSDLIRQIDNDIDGYYKNRKINVEVARAISFVYRNNKVKT